MTDNKIIYLFKGLIHPERATLSIEEPIKSMVIHQSTKKELEIELSIRNNQLTIWITTNEEWDIFDLRNIARHYSNTYCSVLTFTIGHYYTVEIIQILCKKLNIDYVFGIDVECISKRSSLDFFANNFKKVLASTTGELGVFIARCLMDLRTALENSEDTAFHCYRSIESLRQYVKVKYNINDKNDEKSWAKLWEISSYNREYIKVIESKSGLIRHGNIGLIDIGENRADYLLITWNVVEDFIKKECLHLD
jgi:hypothetical protein